MACDLDDSRVTCDGRPVTLMRRLGRQRRAKRGAADAQLRRSVRYEAWLLGPKVAGASLYALARLHRLRCRGQTRDITYT